MSPNSQSPLSEKRVILAIVLSVVLIFLWDRYFAPKPKRSVAPPAAQVAQSLPATNPTSTTAKSDEKSQAVKLQAAKTIPANILNFENDQIRFEITSSGMGVQNIKLKKFKNRSGAETVLGEIEPLFQLKKLSDNEAISFDLQQPEPGVFIGTAKIAQSVWTRTLVYNQTTNSFENKIVISKPSAETGRGFYLTLSERKFETKGGSFLFPSYDHQDFFVESGGKSDVNNINHAKESYEKNATAISLFSLGNQYLTSALYDLSDVAPDARMVFDSQQGFARAQIIYKPTQLLTDLKFQQKFYVGPKSLETLKAVDPQMDKLIDFGWLWWVARPLLAALKIFHGWVGNWGFAIILLTLLVRSLVLPFNLFSFKSMRAMQVIQPELAELRKRYKDDAITMNREVMALMKRNKANPVGGCLPALLQIPIFFALFRVIGSSVELYQSPFLGWIHDLSLHDPFFVLPLMMGGTMFWQQKITPSTMDPTQAKIMAFLPVVFSGLMLKVPSGLSLYMVISSLFGIAQQTYFMKSSKRS